MRKTFLGILCFVFGLLEGNDVTNSVLIDSSKALNNKGVKSYKSGDYKNALAYYQQALDIKKLIYPKNSDKIAITYNNMGLIKMNQWDFRKAKEYYSKAEAIYLKNKDTAAVANIYSNTGYLHSLQGEYALSEQYYRKALSDLDKMTDKTATLRKAEINIRYATLENKRKNYNKSVKMLTTALKQYKNIDPSAYIFIYVPLHHAYIQLEEFNNADESLGNALVYIERHPKIPLHNKASILLKRAELQIKLKEYPKAYSNIRLAYKIINDLNIDSKYYIEVYKVLSAYYIAVSNYNRALEYYQKSLQIFTNESSISALMTPSSDLFNSSTAAISLLKEKAACLIDWHNTNQDIDLILTSLETCKVAIELIDRARNGYISVESKILLSENESSIYEIGLFCAYTLFKEFGDYMYLEEAFYFAEKSKSSVLSSVLQEEKAKSLGNIPRPLLEREEKLKKEITFYKERLYDEKLKIKQDTLLIQKLSNYLFEYTNSHKKLKAVLEEQYPDYYTLKYNEHSPKISDIQNLINANSSIIEYTMTESNLYVFLIEKENVELYEIKINKQFSASIIEYLNQFKNFNYLGQDKDTYITLQELGHNLFVTLIDTFTHRGINDNLIIIPDNILSYLPFEALITKVSTNEIKTYDQLHFLLNDYAISYSYSASLLYESWSGTNRKFHNKILSISPEYSIRTSERLVAESTIGKPRFRDRLLPIPYAIEEAEQVSAMTAGKSLLGKEATEHNFEKLAGNYDVLHLAMHTIIDDNNPLYSKLVFYDENYLSDKGLLTTNEIFGLDLKAKMTVLSSCSSGEGELKKGEGVFSLARGFFYAGCSSLIMTLWQVEDESGLLLMRYYYKYLIRGWSKTKALQKAKLEYMKKVPNEKKHPFYWSAYICIGNPTPIYFPKVIIFSTLVFILLILLLVRHYKLSKQDRSGASKLK